MKKNKKIKIVGIITVIEIISWVMFTLLDFFTAQTENIIFAEMLMISILIIPIMISIIYLKNEKKVSEKFNISVKEFFIISLILWFIETIFVGSYIWELVNYNKWIIKYDHYISLAGQSDKKSIPVSARCYS